MGHCWSWLEMPRSPLATIPSSEQILKCTHLSTEETAWPPHSHNHSSIIFPERLCFKSHWFWGEEKGIQYHFLSAWPQPLSTSQHPAKQRTCKTISHVGKSKQETRIGNIHLSKENESSVRVLLYNQKAPPPYKSSCELEHPKLEHFWKNSIFLCCLNVTCNNPLGQIHGQNLNEILHFGQENPNS